MYAYNSQARSQFELMGPTAAVLWTKVCLDKSADREKLEVLQGDGGAT